MANEEQQPDNRPRPRYGELAPPGWSWTPPEDAERLDTSRLSPAASEQDDTSHAQITRDEPAPRPNPGAAERPPQLRSDAPRWNMTATVVLLVFGFFGMVYSIGTLQALPAAMQLMHSSQNLPEFTATDEVGIVIAVGSILLGLLWAVSAGLSVWLLVRKRLAFYVPLITGVVALLALFVFVGIVLATDPVLLDFYGGIPASPDPTSTMTPSPTTPGA